MRRFDEKKKQKSRMTKSNCIKHDIFICTPVSCTRLVIEARSTQMMAYSGRILTIL